PATVALVLGRATVEQLKRLRRATVISKDTEQGIDRILRGADMIAAGGRNSSVGVVADQVKALRDDRAKDVRAGAGSSVQGDDAVPEIDRARQIINAAADVTRVATKRAVDNCHHCRRFVVDAATLVARVCGNRRVGDREGTGAVSNTTTLICPGVARHGAV